MTRPISLQGRPLADGRLPAICAPLVARTHEALIAEARVVAAKQPDLLEWRVDFFGAIADTDAVLAAARALRQAAGGIPVLFTRRSSREGGEPIPLDEPGVVALYRAVCEARVVEMVDFEMDNAPADVRAVRDAAHAAGLALVLSFHDFRETPPQAALVARFAQAERLGADVAKVAVMPRAPEDVLVLLQATAQAGRECGVPVAGMAMGGWGAVSRVGGGVFGSALTFAVGQNPSAPGQLAIEDVRSVTQLLRRAVSGS